MRKKPLYLSVIVPTINSITYIDDTIIKYYYYLEGLKRDKVLEDYELIIIPQSSVNAEKDELHFIERFKRYKKIARVHPFCQKGKGIALRFGIFTARYNNCLLIDDDMEYDIKCFESFIGHIDESDIIIGSRLMEDSVNIAKLKRKILSNLYRMLCNILFGIYACDIQSGMKLVKKDKILPLNLQEDRFVMDTEMIYKAWKRKYVITQVPVTYEYIPRNKPSPNAIAMLKDLINLWRRTRAS